MLQRGFIEQIIRACDHMRVTPRTAAFPPDAAVPSGRFPPDLQALRKQRERLIGSALGCNSPVSVL